MPLGFDSGGAHALGLLFAGVALFAAVGALSHQRERAFTAAIVYLVLGVALSVAGSLLGVKVIDPFRDAEIIEHVAEIAVIIALFSAGLKIERPLGWRGWRSAIVLLAVVMPLTIAAVALLGMAALGLSAGAAIVLGGVLAPTDPVLAGDVQVGPPGEEHEPEARFALTAEAGFNDGLAFPFVLLGLAIAGEAGSGWVAEWVLADVVYGIGGGLLLGALGGRAIAWLITRMHERRLLDPGLDGWLAIATVLALYGATEALGAYGFLAAFAGGLGFRRFERDHEKHARVHSGADTVENFGELTILLLIGSTVTLGGLAAPGPGGWLVIAALLLLIRPAVTWLALLPTRIRASDRAFVGWLGIRGIGSVYYLAVVLGSGALAAEEERLVYWTVVACVALSIIVHGVTSTPLARRLGL